jgi:hypothetical protein
MDRPLTADRFQGHLSFEFSAMLSSLHRHQSFLPTASSASLIRWSSFWGTLYNFRSTKTKP